MPSSGDDVKSSTIGNVALLETISRRIRIAAILIALLALVGLVEDSLDGFRFTRSVRSWPLWVGGLVFGGLVYAIGETAFEWITAADRTTDPLGRRIVRLLMGAAFVSGLLIAVLLLIEVFSR